MRWIPSGCVRIPTSSPSTTTSRSSSSLDGPRRHAHRGPSKLEEDLDVVVEGELVGMRTQPDGIHLILPLVVDPRLDQVGGEDIALEEEGVILLQVVEDDVERPRELLDLLLLGGG